jgi:hypothetical protein
MVGTNQRPKAPYSRPGAVLTTLRRNRERGVPEPVNAGSLERIGLTTATVPHVLQALRYLGLITKEGERAEVFERMQRVGTEDEYRTLLYEQLRIAYKPVFDVVDPVSASHTDLDNAFRLYDPPAMRDRMVTLFIALCQEAGLVPSDTSKSRTRASTSNRPRTENKARKPSSKGQQEQQGGSEYDDGFTTSRDESAADYSLLAALFRKLPKSGTWTESEYERWMRAFEVNLSLSVEILPDPD